MSLSLGESLPRCPDKEWTERAVLRSSCFMGHLQGEEEEEVVKEEEEEEVVMKEEEENRKDIEKEMVIVKAV